MLAVTVVLLVIAPIVYFRKDAPLVAVAVVGVAVSLALGLVVMLATWWALVLNGSAQFCIMSPCEEDAPWVDEVYSAAALVMVLIGLAITARRVRIGAARRREAGETMSEKADVDA